MLKIKNLLNKLLNKEYFLNKNCNNNSHFKNINYQILLILIISTQIKSNQNFEDPVCFSNF